MAGKVILAILNALCDWCPRRLVGVGHGGVTIRTIRMLSHDPGGEQRDSRSGVRRIRFQYFESSLLRALYAAFRDKLLVQLSEGPDWTQ